MLPTTLQPPTLKPRSTRAAQRLGALVRTMVRAFAQRGWPIQLAAVLLVAAMASSLGAWAVHRHAQDLAGRLAALQTKQQAAQNRPANTAAVYEPLAMAPTDAQYMQDLGLLFQLGKEAGVSFGVIEYKSETKPKTPLTVRTIDLRTTEDYPKIKGFISKVLNEVPHSALQEIRIERKDAQAAQAAMLIKLSLVYQARR
jgi:hypothetical protein